MTVARVSSKGWVVIPSKLRKKYEIRPGTELSVVDYGGVLALVPQSTDPLRSSRGLLRSDASLTQALLEERKREREREL